MEQSSQKDMVTNWQDILVDLKSIEIVKHSKGVKLETQMSVMLVHSSVSFYLFR